MIVAVESQSIQCPECDENTCLHTVFLCEDCETYTDFFECAHCGQSWSVADEVEDEEEVV